MGDTIIKIAVIVWDYKVSPKEPQRMYLQDVKGKKKSTKRRKSAKHRGCVGWYERQKLGLIQKTMWKQVLQM